MTLFFHKSSAGCLPAVAGAASSDIHMVSSTFVIAVMHTVHRFTVNADGLAWMRDSACKAVAASLVKAFTACTITVTGMFPADHNVAFAAAAVFVIGAVCYATG